ncbi:hypothetical protein DFH07DRAFT_804851 [Mycena maculata]|uniref:Uncharacterized protein n=1 Tax=Mycena maculata TaxID=230809 RepID=A0AAD7JWV8_9AGAR|nr:hypothetical protein DFH07DRAFT_804851 [Mycena maculata]
MSCRTHSGGAPHATGHQLHHVSSSVWLQPPGSIHRSRVATAKITFGREIMMYCSLSTAAVGWASFTKLLIEMRARMYSKFGCLPSSLSCLTTLSNLAFVVGEANKFCQFRKT